jgi:hypothetical protein
MIFKAKSGPREYGVRVSADWDLKVKWTELFSKLKVKSGSPGAQGTTLYDYGCNDKSSNFKTGMNGISKRRKTKAHQNWR